MRADAIVIGAGLGGLGAAVTLARQGARVVVFEALTYPGGCAATFVKDGHRFDAGATVAWGLAEGQLLRRWLDEAGIALPAQVLDPALELRTPGWRVAVSSNREVAAAALGRLPGVDPAAVRRYLAWQGALADALWPLFDDPDRLPWPSPRAWPWWLTQAPRMARALPWLGRPLVDALAAHGLDHGPFRTFVDAACQITVQCGAGEAEAAFAASAVDALFRAPTHVHGGIGRLAEALVAVIRHHGGEVRFADRVRDVQRHGSGWRVVSRSGEHDADRVLANVLPAATATWDGGRWAAPTLDAAVHTGWGAVMRYVAVQAPADAPPGPLHLQLVGDPARPLVAGNHAFLSIGGADEAVGGLRPMTVSTHLPMPAGGPEVDAAQAALDETLSALAPEWLDAGWARTASPRTFTRFVRRPGGYVGGVPKRAGWSAYRHLGPTELGPGLFLVGDTVFPGQGTLPAAIGGARAAARAVSPVRGRPADPGGDTSRAEGP